MPAAVLAAAGVGGAAMAGLPVTLNTTTVRAGDMGVYLQAIGTVTPVYTTSITPQATGPITEINYREGQLISKGEPLIQIDPRPYQAVVTTDGGIPGAGPRAAGAGADGFCALLKMPGRTTLFKNRLWMTRKSWWCKRKERSRATRALSKAPG